MSPLMGHMVKPLLAFDTIKEDAVMTPFGNISGEVSADGPRLTGDFRKPQITSPKMKASTTTNTAAGVTKPNQEPPGLGNPY